MVDYLIHYNPWHWEAGAPGGQGGRFRSNPYVETGKWTNPDDDSTSIYGTRLTAAGQRHYQNDIRRNLEKKASNRLDVKDYDKLIDPDRWMYEDLSAAKEFVSGVESGAKTASQFAGKIFKDPPRGPRYNLSDMSDAELRNILNRESMERQYNDYFNPQQENKGRKAVQGFLDAAGTLGGLAATGLGIALSISKLRGGGGSSSK